jgi:hypothetical protein
VSDLRLVSNFEDRGFEVDLPFAKSWTMTMMSIFWTEPHGVIVLVIGSSDVL